MKKWRKKYIIKVDKKKLKLAKNLKISQQNKPTIRRFVKKIDYTLIMNKIS